MSKVLSMARFRPRPHEPVPGSVRSHDVPRLRRLRSRLARRWERRRKRHLGYLGVAFAALGGSMALGTHAFGRIALGVSRGALEIAAVVSTLAVVLPLAVYALWRSDPIRRRARSARIRLHHVERRLAALRGGEES
jgi:hypothetical protein